MKIFCDSSTKQGCVVIEGQEPWVIDYAETVTNNVGEYCAVWYALDFVIVKGYKDVTILTDSQLVVGQTVGLDGLVWKCQKEHLLPLRDSVRALLKETGAKLEWIEREKNLAGHILGD